MKEASPGYRTVTIFVAGIAVIALVALVTVGVLQNKPLPQKYKVQWAGSAVHGGGSGGWGWGGHACCLSGAHRNVTVSVNTLCGAATPCRVRR